MKYDLSRRGVATKSMLSGRTSARSYNRETHIAKVGFGRKPALYPGRAESRLFDMALKLSKMV